MVEDFGRHILQHLTMFEYDRFRNDFIASLIAACPSALELIALGPRSCSPLYPSTNATSARRQIARSQPSRCQVARSEPSRHRVARSEPSRRRHVASDGVWRNRRPDLCHDCFHVVCKHGTPPDLRRVHQVVGGSGGHLHRHQRRRLFHLAPSIWRTGGRTNNGQE